MILSEEELESMAIVIADRVERKLYTKQPQVEEDKIFTVPELAAYIKVSKDWIHKRTAHKEIPHMKLGGKCQFRKSTIDAWLIKQRVHVVNKLSTNLKTVGMVGHG